MHGTASSPRDPSPYAPSRGALTLRRDMHPDFFAIRIDEPAPAGRAVCVEVGAHAFYGKAWSCVAHAHFERFVTGLEVLAEGRSTLGVGVRWRPSPESDGITMIDATPIALTGGVQIAVAMDFPEGALRTQLVVARTAVAEFAQRLRAAWGSPLATTVEVQGS